MSYALKIASLHNITKLADNEENNPSLFYSILNYYDTGSGAFKLTQGYGDSCSS